MPNTEEIDEFEAEEFDQNSGTDMQASGSDVDMDGEDDEEQEVDVEEEDELEEGRDDDLEDDEQDSSDLDALSSPPVEETRESGPSGVPPRLRIKLKLPAQSSASSLAATASATPTPDGRTRRRNMPPRGSDIESEDEDDADEQSTRSASVATSTAHGRALTARQAVLANVVDSSHVSLIEPPNPRKKKPLTEIELALKREETARKRKNLSEKKLEDEKAETINRLLKKQSRSKTKRNALSTAEDRPTPLISGGNGDLNGEGEDEVATATIIPSMYRWVSSTRPVNAGDEREMLLSFSVPVNALPQAHSEAAMDIDRPAKSEQPQCDISGCLAPRKYRLVKDLQRGACGMVHLKALEAQPVQ